MAIGLGISSSYNSNSATTTAWEGTLDAISAGILLYTGLVEASSNPVNGDLQTQLTFAVFDLIAARTRDSFQSQDPDRQCRTHHLYFHLYPDGQRNYGAYRLLGVSETNERDLKGPRTSSSDSPLCIAF